MKIEVTCEDRELTKSQKEELDDIIRSDLWAMRIKVKEVKYGTA